MKGRAREAFVEEEMEGEAGDEADDANRVNGDGELALGLEALPATCLNACWNFGKREFDILVARLLMETKSKRKEIELDRSIEVKNDKLG
jgi:hypothetical protein